MTKKSQKKSNIIEIAHTLDSLGHLQLVDTPDIKCAVVKPIHNWALIAGIASTMGNGTWLVRRNGVCQSKGVGTSWIMSEESYSETMVSKNVAKEITGKEGGWSVASNSRRIFDWAIRNEEGYNEKPHLESFTEGRELAYHTCTPGEYDDCVYFDGISYYFHLLQRLASLKWRQIYPGRWIKRPHTPEENARVKYMFEAIGEFKQLRNSLWGSCLGSINGGKGYIDGGIVDTAPYRGSAPTAALLVSRMAYELTQAVAIETESYYCMTDSAIFHKSMSPNTWDFYGIPYKLKREGDADIRYRHSYKIGGIPTKPFRQKERWREYVPIGNLPDRLFVKEFL